MSTVTIEVCNDGTISRACARMVNAHIRKASLPIELVSGLTVADSLIALLHAHGVATRDVDAAKLTGADKARHTREVNRSKASLARSRERVAAAQAQVDAAAVVIPRRPMPFPRVAA